MPELDLCRFLSVSDAALYLLAVILYPRDPAERAQLFARLQNSHTSYTFRRGLQPAPGRIDQVLYQPTGLDEQDSDRTIGANAAAIMFRRALMDGKSLNSTCKELHKHHGIGESTCWRYWNQFRPAVHLNAARCFWPELWHSERPDLMQLLSNAEELRRRGEAHRMPKSGRLLNQAEMWGVPEGANLPSHTVDIPEGAIRPLP